MKEPEQIENKDKISFKQWQEKEKLTLRKNQIFDTLFTKRKLNFMESELNKNKYNIIFSSICRDKEVVSNPELYIKTKFNINYWLSYLFSKDIIEIKQALYLIELYVRKQITEIPPEKRVLSQNNYEVINCLCNYLNHSDKQIAYYSCRIISNLTYFPYYIEKLIFSEKNLKEINNFINTNDFDIGHAIIGLLINCCANQNVRKYLVDNKIIERITFLINNNLDQLETKYYILLIRLLYNIIKLFSESDQYTVEQVKNWFLPLLNFFKKTLENNYVKNPWYQRDEFKFYLGILNFYSKLCKDDIKLINEIIGDNFIEVLKEFYYKLDEENKYDMMKIFGGLLAYDDSINQLFINEDFLGLLMNEINRIGYKNNKLLYTILYTWSNIACGPQGQIEQIFGQGILWKAIDILDYFITGNIFTNDINNIIYNGVYLLNEAILGGSNNVKVELMMYQNFLIIKLYYYFLKNDLYEENNIRFLEQIGKGINKLIECGDSEFDEEMVIKFRNKLITVGMEELVNNILFNYEGKNIQIIFKKILEFIEEEEI